MGLFRQIACDHRKYFGRQPVIIDGAATAELWPLAFEKWRKPALIEEFGERSVLVRSFQGDFSTILGAFRCVFL